MTVRKLSRSETDALLRELAENRNCPFGCDCAFCHEFALGVESGKHDARIDFDRELDEMKRRLCE
jgi:hypothetical protein